MTYKKGQKIRVEAEWSTKETGFSKDYPEWLDEAQLEYKHAV